MSLSRSFIRNLAFLRWHPSSASLQAKKCNPCLRNVLLPMSRNGHSRTSRSLLNATRPPRASAPARIRPHVADATPHKAPNEAIPGKMTAVRTWGRVCSDQSVPEA
jgi:hypothetical protein